jgi:hypothetical protein
MEIPTRLHGKMHAASFRELWRDGAGLDVRVLDPQTGTPAADDVTVASVRSGDGGGEIAWSSIGSVQDLVAAIRDEWGLKVAVHDLSGRPVDPSERITPKVSGESSEEERRRASDIRMTGQKLISTLQREFTERFPFLGLMLFSAEEWEKSLRGERIKPLPSDRTLASVRTKKATEELSIHGNTKVGNLENEILDTFGLYSQVCLMQGGKKAYTGTSHNGYSLSELNRRREEATAERFVY